MYSIIYKTKQGSDAIITSLNLDDIKNEASKMSKIKLTGSIYFNGKKIGWIGEDLSQRSGWGYFIDHKNCS